MHDELSLDAARASILHGFDLARKDGLLYLSVCSPHCHADTHREVKVSPGCWSEIKTSVCKAGTRACRTSGVTLCCRGCVMLQGLTYMRCYGLCSHAMAVTKHKAATLLLDMHGSMLEYLKTHDSVPAGHSVDQMLYNYARMQNGTWTTATNLVSPVERSPPSVGIFYQDKTRFHSTIDLR